MAGITSNIVLWSMRVGQVTLRSVTTGTMMYSDARVKTQFAANMHAVSATVRFEYRIATVNARARTSVVVGPLTVLYVNCFATSVSVDRMVKPLGGSGPENTAISTGWLVAGFTVCANTWKT